MEPHSYETHLEWVKGRKGQLEAAGLPILEVSTPPEFKGDAGFWTPEHLFVAAEICLMATFLGIAENSRLAVSGYSSTARGKLEWFDGGGYRFTEINILPIIRLQNFEGAARAARVMEKASKGCLIANSMNTNVQVEPQFETRPAVAA